MKKMYIFPALILFVFFFGPPLSPAGQWINPKLLIGDPAKARLQQGREKLTAEEKDEIDKYGYTGLEIMTYVDANKHQGKDASFFGRIVYVGKDGMILTYRFLEKFKYYYKNYLALLTYDGIKPGDLKHKEFGIFLSPSEWAKFGFLHQHYLTSRSSQRKRKCRTWNPKLRKIRENPIEKDDDNWYLGALFTFDDIWHREPWEERHKILGEDAIGGKKCLVVESKSVKPEYYLDKRLVWVERETFLDLHEEQFNKEGKLFKLYDKQWRQILPWNYWVLVKWDAVDFAIKARSVYETHDRLFNQGFRERDFEAELMSAEDIWRSPENPLKEVNKVSDFSPRPEIKWVFWNKMGIKPQVVE